MGHPIRSPRGRRSPTWDGYAERKRVPIFMESRVAEPQEPKLLCCNVGEKIKELPPMTSIGQLVRLLDTETKDQGVKLRKF